MKKTPKPNKTADYSVNALAKTLGFDRRTIDRALVGVRPVRTVGRTRFYHLETAQTALANRSAPELRKLKVEEMRQRIEKLRIANETSSGRLVDKDALAAVAAPTMAAIKATLYAKLVDELPMAMAGVDVPQGRIIGRRHADEICRMFQRLFSAWKI